MAHLPSIDSQDKNNSLSPPTKTNDQHFTVGGEELALPIPSHVLAKSMIFSESVHLGVNRQFRNASKLAIHQFWMEKIVQNSIFAGPIDALKNEDDTWDALPTNIKLIRLYSACVEKIQQADPEADLTNLSIKARNLDLSLYQELADLVTLIAIQPKLIQSSPAKYWFDKHSLKGFREILNDPDNQNHFQNQSYLDLSGLNIDHLPPEINRFTNISRLDLSNNNLTSIPKLDQFAKLHDLKLQNNKICTLQGAVLPDGVKMLDLSDNYITSLKGSKMPAELLVLRLSGNRLTALECDGLPSQLRMLFLANNEIASLQGAGLPKGLTWFYLNNNKITRLDDATLPAVHVLYLDFNMIDSLQDVLWPVSLREIVLVSGKHPILTSSIENGDPNLIPVDKSKLPVGRFPLNEHLKVYEY